MAGPLWGWDFVSAIQVSTCMGGQIQGGDKWPIPIGYQTYVCIDPFALMFTINYIAQGLSTIKLQVSMILYLH